MGELSIKTIDQAQINNYLVRPKNSKKDKAKILKLLYI